MIKFNKNAENYNMVTQNFDKQHHNLLKLRKLVKLTQLVKLYPKILNKINLKIDKNVEKCNKHNLTIWQCDTILINFDQTHYNLLKLTELIKLDQEDVELIKTDIKLIKFDKKCNIVTQNFYEFRKKHYNLLKLVKQSQEVIKSNFGIDKYRWKCWKM